MPHATDIEMRNYGRLDRDGETLHLRFERVLPQPPRTVWRALTEDDHLEAWFPTTLEGVRAAGAPLHFRHRDNEGPPMDGEMLAFEPPSLMEMRWGDDVLRFELEPTAGGGCVLRFTDTFTPVGRAARDAAGWHTCLDLLARRVAGESPPWSSPDRWRRVHPAYVERLGAEAATIGPPEEWERAHGSDASHPG